MTASLLAEHVAQFDRIDRAKVTLYCGNHVAHKRSPLDENARPELLRQVAYRLCLIGCRALAVLRRLYQALKPLTRPCVGSLSFMLETDDKEVNFQRVV